MLQRVEGAWAVDPNIPQANPGIALPLRFLQHDTTGMTSWEFVKGEAVMLITPEVGDAEDEFMVVDIDRKIDNLPKTQPVTKRRKRAETLEGPNPVPRNFKVTPEGLAAWNAAAKTLEAEGPNEDIDKSKDEGEDSEESEESEEEDGKGKGKAVERAGDKGKGKEPAEEENEGNPNWVKNEEELKKIKCGRENSLGGPCGQTITVPTGGFDKGCARHRTKRRMEGYDEMNKKT